MRVCLQAWKIRNPASAAALAPAQRSTVMAAPPFMGPLAGVLPNIYVRAISTDTLRAHPDFSALPPPADIMLAGPQCYRSDAFLKH